MYFQIFFSSTVCLPMDSEVTVRAQEHVEFDGGGLVLRGTLTIQAHL